VIAVTLTGADGSIWDLRSGPVRMEADGVEGFGFPKITRPTRSTPGRSGQRRTNPKSTAAAREGLLPVELTAQSEADYFALSDAWWRAWDPDIAGKLTVTRSTGETREIACFLSEDDYKPDADPSVSLGERGSRTTPGGTAPSSRARSGSRPPRATSWATAPHRRS
jgi:hypothetical protein